MATSLTEAVTDTADVTRVVTPIDTPKVVDEVQKQAGVVPDVTPTLPTGTALSGQLQTIATPETATPGTPEAAQAAARDVTIPTQLGAVSVTAETAPTSNLDVTTPTKPEQAARYSAYQIDDSLPPTAVAAQGRQNSQAIIGDTDIPQGIVSDEAQAVAATEQLDQRATTRYQIESLMQSLNGDEPPAWASPALRSVTAMMQSRGLGSSSMASAAAVQAMMEAAIPIAKSDADAYSAIQLANLNNRQQAVLQNAMTQASMDKANMDARQQAAVANAQSFLQIEMSEMSNEQRVNELDYQGALQAVFTDAAAQNAAYQFNAESQAQVDQFYSQLGVSVDAANANRRAAQDQFNVSAENAMTQYQTSLNDARDQFNNTMTAQINQSNAQWRREIATAETAADNEAARIDAQNLFNLTQTAQNNLWQSYRDQAKWANDTAENNANRALQMVLATMEANNNLELLNAELDFEEGKSWGSAIISLIDIATRD